MAELTRKKFHVQIVTPYELFYEGDIHSLVLPAVDGEIGILSGRTPVIIALNPGELRMQYDEDELTLAVASGYSEIESDSAVVVVNSAEWPDKIDVDRAKTALERAQKRLDDPNESAREKERSNRSLMRAKTRLKVAKKSTKRGIV